MSDIELVDDFTSDHGHLINTNKPGYVRTAILEHWLREQLRDGGKNDVDTLQFGNDYLVHVNVSGNKPIYLNATGTSDLDTLIKAYKQFKEIK